MIIFEIKFKFEPKNNKLDEFIEKIKSFGKIYYNKYSFRECPINIKEDRAYSLSGENNNILTKIGTNCRWMGTICENELDKSIEEHKWKIKILKTKSKYIMVGVAPIDFNIHSSDHTTCGWYFYCYIQYLYSGPPFN